MLNRYPVVYVEWVDHSAQGGWMSVEEENPNEVDDDDICSSVGWLYKDGKERIILISSMTEDGGQVGNKQFISKKLIKKVQYIKPRRRRMTEDEFENSGIGVGGSVEEKK